MRSASEKFDSVHKWLYIAGYRAATLFKNSFLSASSMNNQEPHQSADAADYVNILAVAVRNR
jgi:hypothetical protein